MTLPEFYIKIGGDYSNVMSMLMTEQRIKKYLVKLTANTDYDALGKNLAAGEYKDAFRNSHSLKGMCLNLGLGRLADSACALCEALRKEEIVDDIDSHYLRVQADYAEVLAAISEIE